MRPLSRRRVWLFSLSEYPSASVPKQLYDANQSTSDKPQCQEPLAGSLCATVQGVCRASLLVRQFYWWIRSERSTLALEWFFHDASVTRCDRLDQGDSGYARVCQPMMRAQAGSHDHHLGFSSSVFLLASWICGIRISRT